MKTWIRKKVLELYFYGFYRYKMLQQNLFYFVSKIWMHLKCCIEEFLNEPKLQVWVHLNNFSNDNSRKIISKKVQVFTAND